MELTWKGNLMPPSQDSNSRLALVSEVIDRISAVTWLWTQSARIMLPLTHWTIESRGNSWQSLIGHVMVEMGGGVSGLLAARG